MPRALSGRFIPPGSRGGFWSTVFCTPKKTGGWCPILNLKPLNQFIRPQKFRMDTLASILRCPLKGRWALVIDLQDAYLHVPVAESDQCWLRFQLQGQSYAWTCLPFGLSTSPRVFTMITREVGAYLRQRGVNLCMYLDDWLVYGRSQEETRQHCQLVVETLQGLGFLINFEKSSLTPSQDLKYLGASLRLDLGLATPTHERAQVLVTRAITLSKGDSAPASAWTSLLGLMSSMVDLVPYCRFHMRMLQLHLGIYFRPSVHPDSRLVPMTGPMREELAWWSHIPNLMRGTQFPAPSVEITLTTDASLSGWGGHLLESRVSGTWTIVEARAHINLLELWAVEKALIWFESRVMGRNILVQSDNSTVVAYVNRQGGTRSRSLCVSALRLIAWCRDRGIILSAVHIPGVVNLLADDLSRGMSGSEWILNRQVVRSIFRTYYLPEIDLFASSRSNQLPVYCSRTFDRAAYSVNALALDWSGLTAYAFPPIPILHRVVSKIGEENCNVILIAPMWPKHLWFRPMVELLAAMPRRLPLLPDLLYLGEGACPQIPLASLRLTAWPLSGNKAAIKVFQEKLRLSSLTEEESRHFEFTLSVWLPTTGGVMTEKFLPLELL